MTTSKQLDKLVESELDDFNFDLTKKLVYKLKKHIRLQKHYVKTKEELLDDLYSAYDTKDLSKLNSLHTEIDKLN